MPQYPQADRSYEVSNPIEKLSVEINHKVSDGDWYRLEIAKKCMKSVSNTE